MDFQVMIDELRKGGVSLGTIVEILKQSGLQFWTLILSNDQFDTQEDAQKWAKENDFLSKDPIERDSSYRYLQAPPADGSYSFKKTLEIAEGARVIGFKSSEKPEPTGRGTLLQRNVGDKVDRCVPVTKITGIDEDSRTITGFASTETRDRYSEVVLASAFKNSIPQFMQNPVMLFSHDMGSWPIGKFLSLEVIEGKGLRFVAEFAPTEEGQKAFELYKGGFLNAFSVSFIILAFREATDDDAKTFGKVDRVFTDLDLLEISGVTVPAVPQALADRARAASLGLKEYLGGIMRGLDSSVGNAKATDAFKRLGQGLDVVVDCYGDLREALSEDAGEGGSSKGAALGALLNGLIDSNATEDRDRDAILAELAAAASIGAEEVAQILSGEDACPMLETLDAFAPVLGTTVDQLIAAGTEDGCDYSGGEDDEDEGGEDDETAEESMRGMLDSLRVGRAQISGMRQGLSSNQGD